MTKKTTETITAADVGVLDLTSKGDATKVRRFPRAATFADLRPGVEVVFVDAKLNVHQTVHVDADHESNELGGAVGKVIAVEPNRPGKMVALCMKKPYRFGHSCDGRVPHGHGAYAMPGHLYTLEDWKLHGELAEGAAAKQKEVDALIAGYAEIAK